MVVIAENFTQLAKTDYHAGDDEKKKRGDK